MPHNLNHTQRLIRDRNSRDYQQYLQNRGISMEPKRFQQTTDLMRYLKTIDLAIALDLLPECSCIFHDDEHPSAVIFRANSGDYLYYCRTSDCVCRQQGINILQIVQAIQGSTGKEALKFLDESFNVSLEPMEKPSEKNMFDENIDVLLQKFQEKAPTAFSLLEVTALVGLYDFGKKSMSKIDCDGRKSITLSASNTQLRESLGANRYFRISLCLAQLEYLGFIHRLALYELSKERFQRMINHIAMQKSYNQKESREDALRERIRPINQIQVFFLSDERLALIEENAKRWVQMKYKISTFTYNNVYEKECTFVAHKMYPCGDWLNGDGNSFVSFEHDVKAVLERELAHGEYLSLPALKQALIDQKGWSNKRIQKYLKAILDALCKNDYFRTRVDKKTVIKKRHEDDAKAA